MRAVILIAALASVANAGATVDSVIETGMISYKDWVDESVIISAGFAGASAEPNNIKYKVMAGNQLRVDWTALSSGDGRDGYNCTLFTRTCQIWIYSGVADSDLLYLGNGEIMLTGNDGTDTVTIPYFDGRFMAPALTPALNALTFADAGTTASWYIADDSSVLGTATGMINGYQVLTTDGQAGSDVTGIHLYYGALGASSTNFIDYSTGGSVVGSKVELTNAVIETIDLEYRSDGSVCGISLTSGGTTNTYGCTGDASVETSFSNPYLMNFTSSGTSGVFAGFYALEGANNIFITPISLAWSIPEVVAWSPMDDQITYHIRSYASAAKLYYIYLGYNQFDDASDPSTVLHHFSVEGGLTAAVFDLTHENSSIIVPCGPVQLQFVNFDAEDNDNIVFMSAGEQYQAWTSGWYSNETDTLTLDAGFTAGSGTTYSSKPMYYKNFVRNQVVGEILDDPSNVCYDTLVSEFYFSDTPGTEVYVDGAWLSASFAAGTAAPSATDLSGFRANQVTVQYNNTAPFLITYIEFSNTQCTSGCSYSWGDVSADYEAMFTAAPYDSAAILGAITVEESGSALQSISFHWYRARAPVMLEDDDVENPDGFFSRFFDKDDYFDADMQYIHWWNPADFSSMSIAINGPFNGASDDTFYATSTVSMQRGRASTAIAYQLIPQTTFDFVLQGNFDGPFPSNLVSDESYIESFYVPNGLAMSCTIAGNMTLQVEYEAVPEMAILSQASSSVGTGTLPATTIAYTVKNVQSSLYFPSSTYFRYNSGQGWPQYMDFGGYPTEIGTYWQDQTGITNGNVDSCIRGLFVTYRQRDQSSMTYYLAGSSTERANLANVQVETTDFTSTERATGFDYAQSGDCISGIQFKNSGGATVGGCIGPASTCGTTGVQATQTSGEPTLYLYSMDATVNSTTNTFVYRLEADFASIDYPILVPFDRSTASCQMNFYGSPWYVRDSAWWFSYDLSSSLECNTEQEILADHAVDATVHPDQDSDGSLAHNVMYWQKVTRLRDDPSSSVITGTNIDITRLNAWEAAGFCYYDAEGTVSSGFNTQEETGHTITSIGELDLALDIYTDSSYATRYTETNPTAMIGDAVYVLVHTAEEYDDVVVRAETCWATRSGDPNSASRWDIQTDTCGDDSTFQRNTFTGQTDQEDAFQFNAFAWYVSSAVSADIVYIHCMVRVCPANDTTSCDLATCGVNRQRRDALAAPQDQLVSRANPIIVVNKRAVNEVQQVDSHSALFVTAVLGVMSVVLAVIVLMVIVLAYRLHRARRVYRALNNSHQ